MERGDDVDNRSKKVEHFWETGELDEKTNVSLEKAVQDTFSDGKLNTLVKDKLMRNRKVLEILLSMVHRKKFYISKSLTLELMC